MNLVKTAEDLKNLSDQQLMSAGQNPVVVPPYLVLAEMKRREQMRAEYAKATQQQGQQPTVAQQTAQSLMQGQPQPQQPQQPQPQGQGIMQAMPQGGAPVQAMAGGGQVGRYAEGKSPDSYAQAIEPFLQQMLGMRTQVPPEVRSTLPMTPEEMVRLYRMPTIEEKMAAAQGLVKPADYSQYEAYLQQQMQEAKTKKPRLGDALIAAGAAMAANRDPRVGITNILAQGIGAGSESYRAQQEKQKKDLQTAMMAQMALGKMKQEDRAKLIELASSLASTEAGRNISVMQTVEANRRAEEERKRRERSAIERANADITKAVVGARIGATTKEIDAKRAIDLFNARMAAVANRPTTPKEKARSEAADLMRDAIGQAQTYIYNTAAERKKKGLPEDDPYDLAIRNIRNDKYFKGYSGIAKQLAQEELIGMKVKEGRLKLMQEQQDLREKLAQSKTAGLASILGQGVAPQMTPEIQMQMALQSSLAAAGAAPEQD